MKKISMLFCTALFSCSSILTFAGNRCEVIIPGDHSPKSFKMSPNVKEGDYLPTTIIFKVKPQYRQNCKVNSVDNLLPLQDFLQNIGAQDLAKIYPTHRQPEQEKNALGQKLVDLSLMYSFKYTNGANLEKTINQMLSLGYFEYVEPWYVPKIHLFTPNDPSWSANQYHLKGNVKGSINTQTAWMTQTGNTSIIIGIVDTGTEPTHPDLSPNMVPGYDVAMNDSDPTWQGSNHGCATSGDACAATNNSIGVASPGFNCKFMPVKIADAAGTLVAAYEGITYAADHGCKIISNSWGGAGGGQSGQDVINYAAINKNCLVIASAGNNGGLATQEDPTYPSSYNNVYRVAASTSTDIMASFSSFGLDVDYTAPGNAIYSTIDKATTGGYGSMSGTSMACPVSAGAAGLIQSQFNYTNAFQIGERLKQTCDPMTGVANYTAGKLGKGRINVGTAVSTTVATKSLTMNPVTVTDKNDNVFEPSEVLYISGIFINYLDPSSTSAVATFSVVSGPATVGTSTFTIGALATLAIDSNVTTPFTATVNANAGVNAIIKFRVRITDGTFIGDQYFSVTVNPDYINIVNNDVHTSITSKGRIGYNADGQTPGLGFQYQIPNPAADLLYEMSLIIGTSSTKVSDDFRGATVGNNDYTSVTRVHQVVPAVVSDFDVNGVCNDAASTTTAPLGVTVNHSAYAWSTAPYRKFVIVKYSIKNTSASALSNLYAGLVADWDIPNADAAHNKGSYDAANKMGYCWNTVTPLYAAIKLLSSAAANNYIIDNIAGGNGGVDPTVTSTGFTTAMKYTVLSTSRNNDGYVAAGGDVMDCLSSGPFTINAGDSVVVAFALIGGDNLVDIQASACAAQNKYDNSCTVGVNDLETDNFWMYNYPNPATNSMNIDYNIVGYDHAAIRVMNTLGEVVMTLDNIPVGKNTLNVDVSKLSTGNYFYQLKAGQAVMTKKMTIMK